MSIPKFRYCDICIFIKEKGRHFQIVEIAHGTKFFCDGIVYRVWIGGNFTFFVKEDNLELLERIDNEEDVF